MSSALEDSWTPDSCLRKPLAASEAVVPLLTRYSEFVKSAEESSKMASSPVSVLSQYAQLQPHLTRRQQENQDSSPISQVRLETQLPVDALRRTPLRGVGGNARVDARTPSAGEAEPSSVEKRMLDDILKKPRSAAERRNRNLTRDAAGLQVLRRREFQLPSEGSVISSQTDKIAVKDKISTDTSTTMRESRAGCEIDHVQTLAPSLNTEAVTAAAEISEGKTPQAGAARAAAAGAAGTDHYPNIVHNMHLHFRRWRAEAARGRHIRGSACRIPKAQLRILESEQRWQPPLPGQYHGLPTIPIDLLNELTKKADQAAIAVTPPQDEGSKETMGNTADNVRVKENVKASASRFDDLPSSQVLSGEDWEESPERVKSVAQLPPDSSPVSPSRLLSDQIKEVAADEADLEDELDSQAGTQGFVEAQTHDNLASPRQNEKSQSLDLEEEAKSQRSAENLHPPSTSSNMLTEVQVIQVKNTPFPGRLQGGMPGLSVPPADGDREVWHSTYVPGTYVESSHEQVNTAVKEIIVPHQTTSSAACQTDVVRQPKRKESDDQQAGSLKRQKFRYSYTSTAAVDPDYASVFEDKRHFRRQQLQAISKPTFGNPKNRVRLSSSTTSPVRSHGSSSALWGAAASAQEKPIGFSTPATILTSNDSFTRESKASSHSLPQNRLWPVAIVAPLYQRFKRTYGDYEGTQAQFEVALELLTDLRRDCKKYPHPLMYDDFAFHRHHSYRPYKASFVDSNQTAVDYIDFFMDLEDADSHRAKVINLAIVDQLIASIPDHGSRDGSLPSVRPLSNAEASKGPVTAGSLINNIAIPTGTHRQSQQGAEDPLADPPAEQMHPSQKSSVESWIENTALQARAISPELGSPEIISNSDTKVPEKSMAPPLHDKPTRSHPRLSPTVDRTQATRPALKRKKPRATASPFVVSQTASTRKPAQPALTPFQRYAKRIMGLPDERQATSAPSSSGLVNIFAWTS